MKKDRCILVAVIVLIILNVFSWGLLWQSNGNSRMTPSAKEGSDMIRRERLLLGKLDFNESQKRQVKKLKESHIQEIRQLQEAHRALRESYVTMAMSPDYNPQRADSLFKKMSKINGEMQQRTWIHFRNIYEICDKKQKIEFRNLMLRLNKLQSSKKHPPLSRPR
jgi:Spy/CpxP family protein refolding chaperone